MATATTTAADTEAVVVVVVAMAIVTTTEATAAVMTEDTMIAEVTIPEKVLSCPQTYLTSGEQCFVSRSPEVIALTLRADRDDGYAPRGDRYGGGGGRDDRYERRGGGGGGGGYNDRYDRDSGRSREAPPAPAYNDQAPAREPYGSHNSDERYSRREF